MAQSGTIRRLWSAEREQIRAHLLRLDEEDRRLTLRRLCSSARIAAYCAELGMTRGLVLGYVVAGRMRGIGELKPLPGRWPRAAEIAISIERPFQGRGIGSALLRRLVIVARNRLYERLCMVCLMDNGRMVRMARRSTAGSASIRARSRPGSSRPGPPPGPCSRRPGPRPAC